jgi:iron complex transport system substrate-binding protein
MENTVKGKVKIIFITLPLFKENSSFFWRDKMTFKFLLLFLIVSTTFAKDLRVVSLGPIVTKQLYLLGLTDEVVGNSEYCVEPEGVKKAEKVGSVIKSSIEKIVTLTPNIVFATGLSDPAQLNRLKSLGLRVESISTPATFVEMKENLIKIGDMIGKGDLAREIVNKADEDIAKISNPEKRRSIFFQIGKDPIFTVIKRSFMNDIILLAGGNNIAENNSGGIYSREKVVEQDPQFIVITTMGGVGKDEVEIWKKFSEMRSVKSGNIYIVEQDLFCSPTVKDFPRAVKKLHEILYK